MDRPTAVQCVKCGGVIHVAKTGPVRRLCKPKCVIRHCADCGSEYQATKRWRVPSPRRCVVCRALRLKEQAKAKRQRHSDKQKARSRAWYVRNKERLLREAKERNAARHRLGRCEQCGLDFVAARKGVIAKWCCQCRYTRARARKRKLYATNIEKGRAASRQNYHNHRDRRIAQHKRWRAANRDKVVAYAKRRAADPAVLERMRYSTWLRETAKRVGVVPDGEWLEMLAIRRMFTRHVRELRALN